MKSHYDRYFELLPTLVIVLLLVLADGARELIRDRAFSSIHVAAPEQLSDAPRLIFR
jgi:hypothetical protein